MPEFLPRVNVREVNFNGWELDGSDRVAQRDTRMSIRCRVEDYPVKLAFGLLQPINQFTFDIGLPESDGGSQFARPLRNTRFYLCQGHSAIFLRLTCSK